MKTLSCSENFTCSVFAILCFFLFYHSSSFFICTKDLSLNYEYISFNLIFFLLVGQNLVCLSDSQKCFFGHFFDDRWILMTLFLPAKPVRSFSIYTICSNISLSFQAKNSGQLLYGYPAKTHLNLKKPLKLTQAIVLINFGLI